MGDEYELFEVGDWVTWRYKPADPEGPYRDRWVFRPNRHYGNNPGGLDVRDTIEDSLLRYRKPPYRVVKVFASVGAVVNLKANEKLRVYLDPLESVGHPQSLKVVMYLKPGWGGWQKKIRSFSGKLFVTTHSPRKPK